MGAGRRCCGWQQLALMLFWRGCGTRQLNLQTCAGKDFAAGGILFDAFTLFVQVGSETRVNHSHDARAS